VDVVANFKCASNVVTAVAAVNVKATYSMTTYDLMGNPIDTAAVDKRQVFDPLINDYLDLTETVSFTAPPIGFLLNKPMVQSVGFNLTITLESGEVISNFTALCVVEASITLRGGSAYGSATPSTLWACSEAVNQQISFDIIQIFEATPNSNLLETTTTILHPVGSILQQEQFFECIAEMIEDGTWHYVCEEKDFMDDAHACHGLNWVEKLPAVLEMLAKNPRMLEGDTPATA